MKMIIAIALGGAAGAVSRHFVSHRVAEWVGHGFPAGTLAVNVIGSFLMGLIVTLLAQKLQLSQEARAFLTVGLLGGFTTFSTFSMETVLLIERHTYGLAAAYVLASLVLAVGGLFAGMWCGRAFL